MSREELIEKMLDEYHGHPDRSSCYCDRETRNMAAALDVAIGELLHPIEKDEHRDAIRRQYGRIEVSPAHLEHGESASLCAHIMNSRRSRYLKPKSAEEKLRDEIYTILRKWQAVDDPDNCNEESAEKVTERIVAAVRKADHDRV